MDVLKFLQQLTTSGVVYTVLRNATKRGAVIKVTLAGGAGFAYVRIKPTSLTS